LNIKLSFNKISNTRCRVRVTMVAVGIWQ